MIMNFKFFKKTPLVAILPLDGVISGKDLNLAKIKPIVDRIIEAEPALLVLDINSPGGSPVESLMISEYITAKCVVAQIPVTAYCREVAASGGYWLALTSDYIYITPMTIVGSIGVVGGGFGFPGLLEKLGITRRLYTIGKNKALNDPFSEETVESVAKIKRLQTSIYDEFVARVKERRTREDINLLKGTDEDLFNGDVWVGQEAVDLGLVDGVYINLQDHVSTTAQFDDTTPKFKIFKSRKSLRSLLPWSVSAIVDACALKIEERLLTWWV